MTPAEQVSEDVWNRLKQSRELVVRLGEETLTDILTLDFTRLVGRHEARILQTKRHREAKTGTDLEVFLNLGGGKSFRYAIQAKKLYPDERYAHLNPRVGRSSRRQIDVLEDYAKTEGVVPFYLLFNYVDHVKPTQHWHCCEAPDENQLGCTLVPSWRVRQAIDCRGCRTFTFLHSIPEALPFRCRFDCPRGERWGRKGQANRICDDSREYTKTSEEAPSWWKSLKQREHEWPEWLWEKEGKVISIEDERKLFPQLANEPHEFSLPRRLLLIVRNLESDEPTDDFAGTR